ncbi:MAG: hypothetical protein U9M97_02075 [Candidatus Hadarchaeota archaeon]|nr:hypothetical protein [Candidatus Hadarchaeota archaeon]
MYVHGKEVRVTKSAFEDMVKIGLPEHKIISIIEDGRITRIGKTEKRYAEVRAGKKIVRVVYADYPAAIVVISANVRRRKR